MHQTERMLTVIQEVRSPAIMDADALVDRQDAHRIQSLVSSALMHLILGEGCRTGDMLPEALPRYRHARFVLMNDRSLPQCLLDLLLDGSQPAGGALDQVSHRSFTHVNSQQVTQHFAGAFQGQQLLLRQIHRHRSDLGSILDGGRDGRGKRGLREVLAAGTLLVFGAMFLHQHPWRWDVHHLSTKCDARLDLAQIVLTGRADRDPMLNHFIGGLRKLQGRSRVALLPSGFLLALFAQAFWLSHKAIRRGRQTTIVAVFRQPILQGFHLPGQSRNLFLHLRHQSTLLAEPIFQVLDSFIALCHLFTQTLIFFFYAHACTLLGFATFGKPPADLGSYEKTTFARIAYVDEFGHATTIPNDYGSDVTPSVVLFDGENHIVGSDAKDMALLAP